MVLASHDHPGDTGQTTGLWLEELAAAYYVLKDGGAAITLASPKGGKPPLDPRSDLPENLTGSRETRRTRLGGGCWVSWTRGWGMRRR